MKAFVKSCLVIILVAVSGYMFYASNEPVRTAVHEVVVSILAVNEVPCSKPIAYSVGSFDLKFGVSKDYFLSVLRDAEAIWEKPYGKELFIYEPGRGGMTISMVYDYRQEASSKLQSIGITVDKNRATYDTLNAKYKLLKAQLALARISYDAALKSFDDRYAAYQAKVSYWNKLGGAPDEEYAELQAEKTALESELAGIEANEVQGNEMISQINAMVTVINSLADTLNLSVDDYNAVGASLGDSFEEGLFTSDGTSMEIEIYEFRDRDSLVRVLAHELGHALGLDHVADPKAIMFSFNSSTNMALTSDDLSALNAICGVKK